MLKEPQIWDFFKQIFFIWDFYLGNFWLGISSFHIFSFGIFSWRPSKLWKGERSMHQFCCWRQIVEKMKERKIKNKIKNFQKIDLLLCLVSSQRMERKFFLFFSILFGFFVLVLLDWVWLFFTLFGRKNQAVLPLRAAS